MYVIVNLQQITLRHGQITTIVNRVKSAGKQNNIPEASFDHTTEASSHVCLSDGGTAGTVLSYHPVHLSSSDT